MQTRGYDPDRDFEAFVRINAEAGWAKDTPRERDAHRLLTGCGRVFVAEAGGQVECFASTHAGSMRHLEADLPLSVVTGVATGRVARRHGLGLRLTAEAVAEAARDGAAVALLGIFDQGYYDKLGFGTGPYDVMAAVDPADLRVDAPPRVPVRLGVADADRIHALRVARRRGHGSIVLDAADVTRYELTRQGDTDVVGFQDPDSGELTHGLRLTSKDGATWWMPWCSFRTPAQFRDLLAHVAALGDQIRIVRFVEPPGIEVQNFVRRPVRRRDIGLGGSYDTTSRVLAWWQARILDLPACVASTRLPGADAVAFRLELSDPMPDLTAGAWTVTLGPESHAERATGGGADLPVLKTSVNTFSRLWLGVARPSDLAYLAPDLAAPPALLETLDQILRLPKPHPDWDV